VKTDDTAVAKTQLIVDQFHDILSVKCMEILVELIN